MKRFCAFLLSALITITAASCGSGADNSKRDSASSKEQGSSVQQETDPYAEKKAACELNDAGFDKYISNTPVATGNNYVVKSADKITYRAYFPAEEYGKLEYCFYFSNTVDSTYSKGNDAYVGKSGGEYTIESAFIADGGTGTEDEITNKTQVLFGGEESREVKSDEAFWSDPVGFDLPEGHYLVWEWTLTGENIPCTYMSNLTSSTADEDGEGEFVYCDQIPLPQLIGAEREVKCNIAAIGDSITQGCQTEFMAYEFWAAGISQLLGEDYGFWNCGLGWARTSDAAECGNWLARTKTADVVIVAFGTNDIVSGEYGAEEGNTAKEIDAYLRVVLDVLKDAGCQIIVFNAPPEDYGEELETVRTEYNELARKTAEEYGAEYFDFASYLSSPEDPSAALYGGHPNGEGGKIVAEQFVAAYKAMLEEN
ncbi:SGNH/GDSL hydrolase family protein [Ruminococcus sp. Marseille-P6503]|uniref:SGNH/GDSL hydrolase family protein n=1 Tax=Ruminococcus sp. Marseille-P6503 TaxID=2364796 RepID=UPI000F527184|nr:SGNH/GDSL hydrolase family protein [Ruminococcus sp. Marseille-P6503]